MRHFDYIKNNLELTEAYYICKKIIQDVLDFDYTLLINEELQVFNSIKEETQLLKDKFNFNIYDISFIITKELLEPNNVEYCIKHKKYPPNASKTGDIINNLFKKIFIIEDKMQILVSKIWERIVTPFEKIENGKPFTLIGHSGSGYIIFPSSKYYINNEYNNITSYSCSIFTNNHMQEFNSKLVAIFDINKENFVCASHFDSATNRGSGYASIKTLKTTDDGHFINAGYSSPQGIERIVTKSECPLTTLSKLNKNNINEVVLDKSKSKPVGLVLFSNGCDFLMYEYINAIRMKNDYNLDLKVINKTLYQNIEIDINKMKEEFLHFKNYILQNNFNIDELISLLDGYMENIIIPLKLDKNVEEIQIEFIERFKEELKSKNIK